jgi:hypothetical protein
MQKLSRRQNRHSTVMRVILGGGWQHGIAFLAVFLNIRTTVCWTIANWQNIMPPAVFRNPQLKKFFCDAC